MLSLDFNVDRVLEKSNASNFFEPFEFGVVGLGPGRVCTRRLRVEANLCSVFTLLCHQVRHTTGSACFTLLQKFWAMLHVIEHLKSHHERLHSPTHGNGEGQNPVRRLFSMRQS